MSDEIQVALPSTFSEPLWDYIKALEAIIRSLPGEVTINGVAYSNDEGIAELRRRFGIAVAS